MDRISTSVGHTYLYFVYKTVLYTFLYETNTYIFIMYDTYTQYVVLLTESSTYISIVPRKS